MPHRGPATRRCFPELESLLSITAGRGRVTVRSEREQYVSGRFEPLTPMEEAISYVGDHPGANATEISRAVNRAGSSVVTALKALEREGHVESTKARRERSFFARFTAWEMEFLPLALGEEPRLLLKFVARRPGADNQMTVTEATGLAANSVQRYVKA